MASDAHPWRDIYSLTDWNNILANTTRAQALPQAAPTGWTSAQVSPNTILKRLTDAIQRYHAIRKDDINLFDARINVLNEVEDLAGKYIHELGANAQLAKTGPGGTKDFNPINHQRLDPWIVSLQGRAAKKAQYLMVMSIWITSAKTKYTDPVPLMADLASRDQSNQRGNPDEPLLTATPYAKMEKIDPYHRNIVFFVSGNMSVAPYNNNPMAVAFGQWLTFRNNPLVAPNLNQNASFYEWLENHPICTGTPGVTTGFDANYKVQVRKIEYGPVLHAIQVNKGAGLYIDQGAGGGFVPLNTTIFPASGKGVQGGAAFAWDRSGTVWVHQHSSSFRHTSFTGGKKIRCSGMIKVEAGKVTYLSEESGHYAPEKGNLFFFVEWLFSRQCLKSVDATLIEYHSVSQKKQVTLPARDFMTWGRAAYPAYPAKFGLHA